MKNLNNNKDLKRAKWRRVANVAQIRPAASMQARRLKGTAVTAR
jgi:hypothetical protein